MTRHWRIFLNLLKLKTMTAFAFRRSWTVDCEVMLLRDWARSEAFMVMIKTLPLSMWAIFWFNGNIKMSSNKTNMTCVCVVVCARIRWENDIPLFPLYNRLLLLMMISDCFDVFNSSTRFTIFISNSRRRPTLRSSNERYDFDGIFGWISHGCLLRRLYAF